MAETRASAPYHAEPLISSPARVPRRVSIRTASSPEAAVPPICSPTANAAATGSSGRTSRSPLPCVAHDSYTHHTQCGCHSPPVVLRRTPSRATPPPKRSPQRRSGPRAASPPPAAVPTAEPSVAVSSLHPRSVLSPNPRAPVHHDTTATGCTPHVSIDATDASAPIGTAHWSTLAINNGNDTRVLQFCTQTRRGRSLVTCIEQWSSGEVVLAQRDGITNRRLAHYPTPFLKLDPPALPCCLAAWQSVRTNTETAWLGMPDGSIFSWSKVVANSAGVAEDQGSSEEANDDQPQVARTRHSVGRSATTSVSVTSLLSSRDGEVHPATMCHWGRLHRSRHTGRLVAIFPQFQLSRSSEESGAQGSSFVVEDEGEPDAVLTVCTDGIVVMWQRLETEFSTVWRSFAVSCGGVPRSPARTATADDRKQAKASLTCSLEFRDDDGRACVAVGNTSGAVVLWALLADLNERRRDDVPVPADTVTLDPDGGVSPAKQRGAKKRQAKDRRHLGKVSSLLHIPAGRASSAFLCVGYAAGDVWIWKRQNSMWGVHCMLSVAANAKAASSVTSRATSPLQHVVVSMLLVNRLLWCLLSSGECVAYDLETQAEVDRCCFPTALSSVSQPSAAGKHTILPQMKLIQRVSGELLWVQNHVGSVFSVYAQHTLPPNTSLLHDCDSQSLHRSLDNPSVASASFAVEEAPVAVNTSATSELADFERIERECAAAHALQQASAERSATTAAAKANALTFLATAKEELSRVEQRLDERFVLLHEIVEDELDALVALRRQEQQLRSGSDTISVAKQSTVEVQCEARDDTCRHCAALEEHCAWTTRQLEELVIKNDCLTVELEACRRHQSTEFQSGDRIAEKSQPEADDAAMSPEPITPVSPMSPADHAPALSYINGLEEKNLQLEILVQELREKLSNCETELLGARTATLESSQTSSSLAAANEQATSLQVECAQLSAALADADMHLARREAELAEATSKLFHAQAMIETLTTENEALRAALENANQFSSNAPPESRPLCTASSPLTTCEAATRRRSRSPTSMQRAVAEGIAGMCETQVEGMLSVVEQSLRQLELRCALAAAHPKHVADAAVMTATDCPLDGSCFVCGRIEGAIAAVQLVNSFADASVQAHRSTPPPVDDEAAKLFERCSTPAPAVPKLLSIGNSPIPTVQHQVRSNGNSPIPTVQHQVRSNGNSPIPQCQEARIQMEHLQAKNESLEAEIERLSANRHVGAQEFERERKNLLSRLLAQEACINERNKAQTDLAEALARHAAIEETAYAALAEKSNEISVLTTHLTDLQSAVSALQEERNCLAEALSTQKQTATEELNACLQALHAQEVEGQRAKDMVALFQSNGGAIADELCTVARERDELQDRLRSVDSMLAASRASEAALQRASSDLALRVAYCEEQIGTWQSKSNESDETFRRMVVDAASLRSQLEQSRARERDLQDEISTVLRDSRENSALSRTALEAEVTLRLVLEQRCAELQRMLDDDMAATQAPRSLAALAAGADEHHELKQRAAYLEHQLALLGHDKAEIDARLQRALQELDHAHFAQRAAYSNGDSGRSSSIAIAALEAEVSAARRTEQQHLNEIATLVQLIHSLEDELNALRSSSSRACDDHRRGRSLDRRKRHDDDVSFGGLDDPPARKAGDTAERRQASATKKGSRGHHCQYNLDGPHPTVCVWCAGLTVKAMGGSFGVCAPPSRFLEFVHSPLERDKQHLQDNAAALRHADCVTPSERSESRRKQSHGGDGSRERQPSLSVVTTISSPPSMNGKSIAAAVAKR